MMVLGFLESPDAIPLKKMSILQCLWAIQIKYISNKIFFLNYNHSLMQWVFKLVCFLF